MNDTIKTLLQNNKIALEANDFDKLYELCPMTSRSDLTRALLSADIEPLPYMTTVAKFMYMRTYISRIDIPSNIKYVEGDAFNHCQFLEAVKFNRGLKGIDAHAFMYCTSLDNVNLPDTLKYIETGAFGFCTALKSITFPSHLENIQSMAFRYCKQLKQIKLPLSILHIGEAAFADSGLEVIEYEGTWEDLNIISYGKYAFGENKLTIKCSDMTFPDMYW